MICDRCGQHTLSHIGSFFDTAQICFDCDKRERAHPLWEEAHRIETEAVLAGDYNFPGIGLPADFYERET